MLANRFIIKSFYLKIGRKFKPQYSSSLKNVIISVAQQLIPFPQNLAKATAVPDGVKSDMAKKTQPLGQENYNF